MGYITETRLSNIIDIPITLPGTLLQMGDWLVIGSTPIQQPMRLTCAVLNLQVLSTTATISDLDGTNLIYGNLGIVYVILRQNYASGSPGAANGIDTVIATDVGLFSRDITAPTVIVTPGIYTWLIANNTQPSSASSPLIPVSTSIDFEVAVTGSARLDLSYT